MSGVGRGDRLDEVERIEREEFARGHVPPGAEPVRPRPAATLVLARDTLPRFEVLLLRRPESSRFAAGAFVFPGGVIDPEDGSPAATGSLPRGLREPEGAAAVAALRELFEETGLLPADRVPPREALDSARAELLADQVTFPGLVERLDLRFEGLEGAYFARWITPTRLSRRYDTRFFLARSRGGDPRLTAEHTDAAWLSPAEALARFRARELPMLFPTLHTLDDLAGFDDLEAVLEAYAEREVEPIRPRLLVRGGDVKPVMPGEPGYEEAE